jgi:TRAP-type uncharacterized transport system fused permease subunit
VRHSAQVVGIVAWWAKCSKMFAATMNRAQRVVLIVYCLLLTYCCVWIPGIIPLTNPTASTTGPKATDRRSLQVLQFL